MFNSTYEDALAAACERMGYKTIFKAKGRVVVDPCTGKKKDRHVFKNAALALGWVEQQEQRIAVLRVTS